jgi:hypothetical protein
MAIASEILRDDLKAQLLRSQVGTLCLLGLLALCAPRHVLAHSQPGVSGILDQTAAGVQVLRLYQGLVQRDGGKWRFVCSKTYGGGGQDLAGSLPGGGVAIALPMGIALMAQDGTVRLHPDPEGQNGILTAFARSNDKLFALRWRDRLMVSDVVEISESAVRVLWTDTHYWSDIAVGAGSLALVRIGQDEIEDLRLSFGGEVLSEDKAMLPDVRAVTVRVMGDVPYYAARLQNQSLLGRLQQGAWQTVLTAGNALAGPLVMADGTTLVALDGVLSTFSNDVATPLTDTDFVTGLYQLDGHPYACTRTGLRDLASTGLGAQLFDMSELLGPNECKVPEDARSDCELEWQHLIVELLGANIPLATDDGPAQECAAGSTAATDARAPAGQSGAEVANAGAQAAGVGSPSDVPQAGAASAGQLDAAQTSGCACGIVPRVQRRAAAFGYMTLVVWGLFLRFRRKYP